MHIRLSHRRLSGMYVSFFEGLLFNFRKDIFALLRYIHHAVLIQDAIMFITKSEIMYKLFKSTVFVSNRCEHTGRFRNNFALVATFTCLLADALR